MAGALFGEFRGMQDAGWSTTITAYEVFGELQTLGTKGSLLTIPELRQVLCLYAQLSEAGGVYESLCNLMGVVQLKPYSLWPFRDLVQVRQNPKRIIGPNANAMFRKLAQTAAGIGMVGFSRLLENTFRDDIRNGIFHADYILAEEGIRLRRRNGGNVVVIPYMELAKDLAIALSFFELLDAHLSEARGSYQPAREIIGRFSANPPMRCVVESSRNGGFSIQMNGIASETDAAYLRQEQINAKLGGRVLMAYTADSGDAASHLINQIATKGFDVPLVRFEKEGDFEALLSDLDNSKLWKIDTIENKVESSLLLAMPSGFAWVSSGNDFDKLLPEVEPVETMETDANLQG